MRPRRLSARIAVAIWIGTLLMTVPLVYLRSRVAASGHSPSSGGVDELYLLVVLMVSTVGALLASRRPRNLIGWLLLTSGSLIIVAGIGQFYALDAHYRGVPTGAAVVVARLAATLLWLPAICILVYFVPMLFPDGRMLGRRWRYLIWGVAAADRVEALGGTLVVERNQGSAPLLIGRVPASTPPSAARLEAVG